MITLTVCKKLPVKEDFVFIVHSRWSNAGFIAFWNPKTGWICPPRPHQRPTDILQLTILCSRTSYSIRVVNGSLWPLMRIERLTFSSD